MRLYNVNGKLVWKNCNKYKIKWDGKSRSDIQFKTKQFLKEFWISDLCFEEFPVFGTKLKVDIINVSKKIAIEVDGAQHEQFNKHFHNNSRLNYLYSIRRDCKKEDWLELNKFKLIRIKEDEINELSTKFFQERFLINLV